MMLNGGELDGARILTPKTVELMTTDHLRGIPFRDGQGFGLGFSINLGPGRTGSIGSRGEFAWGGQHRVLPLKLRLASLGAVFVLALAAWVALARADILPPGPESLPIRFAVWASAGLFALNALGNLMSKSDTERYGMTPPAVVLVLCFVGLGLAP